MNSAIPDLAELHAMGAAQQPAYPDPAAVDAAVARLRSFPPLRTHPLHRRSHMGWASYLEDITQRFDDLTSSIDAGLLRFEESAWADSRSAQIAEFRLQLQLWQTEIRSMLGDLHRHLDVATDPRAPVDQLSVAPFEVFVAELL